MRGHKLLLPVALLVGFGAGLLLSFAPGADAARNGSGTYSLPTGNPVVSGTTISSSWANTTLADIRSEITNSLDRNGRGAMLAPLQLSNGSSGAPSLTFASDHAAGLYRVASGVFGLQVDGQSAVIWHDGGVVVPKRLAVGTGIYVIGGPGGPGDTEGPGIFSQGQGEDGIGGEFHGDRDGPGAYGVGGDAGAPGGLFYGTGGAIALRAIAETGFNGVGISGNGAGTGYGAGTTGGPLGGIGLAAANGIAATGSTRRTAISASNGDIELGGNDPNSSVAVSNAVTRKNVTKAWANVTFGSATPTVNDGFNIASSSCSSSKVTLTFASSFANTNYGVTITPVSNGSAAWIPEVVTLNTGSVVVALRDTANSTVNVCSTAGSMTVQVLGAQ